MSLRALALLALPTLLACGKSGKPAPTKCEQARELYLAQAREHADAVIAKQTVEAREHFKAESDAELARSRERFPAACAALGDFDVTCFSDREHQKSDPNCRMLGEELYQRLSAR